MLRPGYAAIRTSCSLVSQTIQMSGHGARGVASLPQCDHDAGHAARRATNRSRVGDPSLISSVKGRAHPTSKLPSSLATTVAPTNPPYPKLIRMESEPSTRCQLCSMGLMCAGGMKRPGWPRSSSMRPNGSGSRRPPDQQPATVPDERDRSSIGAQLDAAPTIAHRMLASIGFSIAFRIDAKSQGPNAVW